MFIVFDVCPEAELWSIMYVHCGLWDKTDLIENTLADLLVGTVYRAKIVISIWLLEEPHAMFNNIVELTFRCRTKNEMSDYDDQTDT